jgi:integrase
MKFENAVVRYIDSLQSTRPGTARAWSSPLLRAAQPPSRYPKKPNPDDFNSQDYVRAVNRAGKKSPGLGGKDLAQVKLDDLILLLSAIQDEARSRRNGVGGFGAKENALTAFRAFFVWARANGLTKNNPDDGLKFEKRSERLERRSYTLSELEQVHLVLASSKDPELAMLFLRIALETGARHNEIVELNWGDLRESSGVLVLKPKGFRGYFVDAPITADLYDAIVETVWRRSPKRPTKATPILMYSDGKPISRRYFENLCAKVRNEIPSLNVGEPDYFSTHGLRHTAGTMIQRVGGDAVVRRFLGHSPQGRSHIERYSKATIDEVRAAMVAIWGVPLAGNGHGWGRSEPYFQHQAELQLARETRLEQEIWEINQSFTEDGIREPSPEDYRQSQIERDEDEEAEQRFIKKLFGEDS